MQLNDSEHIEYIGNNLKLIVSKQHTFGTDALLLASFASPRKNTLSCDLGTGCGIIPFYWLRDDLCEKIYAVDIQENAFSLLCRSLEINGIRKIVPVCADLRSDNLMIPRGSLDLVTMNPPYTRENSGIESAEDSAKIARHGVMCSLGDVCKTASYLLKFGGRLCMCIRPERLCELFIFMREYKIEPKRLRLVSQRDSLAPWLALVEGKLGRKPGLIVEPELHIEENGGISPEMTKIIGSYRKDAD